MVGGPSHNTTQSFHTDICFGFGFSEHVDFIRWEAVNEAFFWLVRTR